MAKVRLRKFDPANYLRGEKDLALYLDACLKEGGDDPAFIAAALGDIARVRSIGDWGAEVKEVR
jgi:probable addiction module antidote protein